MIVLDDTQSVDDPNVVGFGGYGHGSLDNQHFDWLVRELDAGQANDQLMTVAAGPYNAELVVALSSEMQGKIRHCGALVGNH